MTTLKPHPYADLVPMMTAAELEALAADIKQNGLRHPVVRYQGMVLDGRNRLLACEKAGVEPAVADHEGDDASALALVISLNVQRRDLTPAQRALGAARAIGPYAEAAARRMMAGTLATDGGPGKASARIAKEFKVGVNQVEQAKALLAEAPGLATQVEACALSLACAYRQLQDRRREAAQKAKGRERGAESADANGAAGVRPKGAPRRGVGRDRGRREAAASRADARRQWLKGLAAVIDWVERMVGPHDDARLASYAGPGPRGLIEHGLTAERIEAAVHQLGRVRTTAFRAKDEFGKAAGAEARTDAAGQTPRGRGIPRDAGP